MHLPMQHPTLSQEYNTARKSGLGVRGVLQTLIYEGLRAVHSDDSLCKKAASAKRNHYIHSFIRNSHLRRLPYPTLL